METIQLSNDMTVEKYESGTIKYFFKNLAHRISGPAYIGGKDIPMKFSWWRMGHRHRLNAPAIIYKDGGKQYYEFGNFIR
jgi:hypothetical protein